MPRGPRTGHAWRKARAATRTRAANGEPCAICGEKIDVNLKYPHPDSFSAEHPIALARGGELLKLVPSHLICNIRKGAGPATKTAARRTPNSLKPTKNSRKW